MPDAAGVAGAAVADGGVAVAGGGVDAVARAASFAALVAVDWRNAVRNPLASVGAARPRLARMVRAVAFAP
jgi:hypothetical protein